MEYNRYNLATLTSLTIPSSLLSTFQPHPTSFFLWTYPTGFYFRTFAIAISSVWNSWIFPQMTDHSSLSSNVTLSVKPALTTHCEVAPLLVILHPIISLYFLHSPIHQLKLLCLFPSKIAIFLQLQQRIKRVGILFSLQLQQNMAHNWYSMSNCWMSRRMNNNHRQNYEKVAISASGPQPYWGDMRTLASSFLSRLKTICLLYHFV